MLKVTKQWVGNGYWAFGIFGENRAEILSYVNFLFNQGIISTPRGCEDALKTGDDFECRDTGNPDRMQYVCVSEKKFLKCRAEWHFDDFVESLVHQNREKYGKRIRQYIPVEQIARTEAEKFARAEFNEIPELQFLRQSKLESKRNYDRPPLVNVGSFDTLSDVEPEGWEKVSM
jgi:hypothetical protein